MHVDQESSEEILIQLDHNFRAISVVFDRSCHVTPEDQWRHSMTVYVIDRLKRL